MTRTNVLRLVVVLLGLAVLNTACSAQASKSEYFGKTEPLPDQYLRYISGPRRNLSTLRSAPVSPTRASMRRSTTASRNTTRRR